MSGATKDPRYIFGRRMLPEFCAKMPLVLVFFCVLVVGQGMIVTGQLTITLSMLERGFGYSSFQSGMIHACYDFCFMVAVSLVSYFCYKHKPFWIGIGAILMAFGCFFFTLPHFIKKDDYYSGLKSGNTHSQHHHVTDSYAMCATDMAFKIDFEGKYCNIDANKDTFITSNTNIWYLIIFCAAYGIIGIGACPLHSLGVAYFHENLKPSQAGLYLGTYYFFAAIGPALAFALGKVFLSMTPNLRPLDPGISITPDSEAWIGAWWMGYLVGGVIVASVAIPLLFFPSIIRKGDSANNQNSATQQTQEGNRYTSINNEQTENNDQTDRGVNILNVSCGEADIKSGVSKCPKSNFSSKIRRVFSNGPFLFMTLGMATEGVYVNGFATFLSKMIEVQFRVTSANASLYSGVLVVAGAGLGMLMSGFVLKAFEKALTPKKKAYIITIISMVTCVLMFSLFFHCPKRTVAGVSIDTSGKVDVFANADQCSDSCVNCDIYKYDPICHEGVTYFNPCVAGCKHVQNSSDSVIFTDCSCLPRKDSQAVRYGCKSKDCPYFIPFMVFFFVVLFLIFAIYVPQLTFTLKVLEEDDIRVFGIGIQQILTRIGFIIGPLLFGLLIDSTCMLWKSNYKCKGGGGAIGGEAVTNCQEYDNKYLSLYLCLTSIGIKFLATVFYFFSAYFCKMTTEEGAGDGRRIATEEQTTEQMKSDQVVAENDKRFSMKGLGRSQSYRVSPVSKEENFEKTRLMSNNDNSQISYNIYAPGANWTRRSWSHFSAKRRDESPSCNRTQL